MFQRPGARGGVVGTVVATVVGAAVVGGAVDDADGGSVTAAEVDGTVVVMPRSASGLGRATCTSPEPANTVSSSESWRTVTSANTVPGNSAATPTVTTSSVPAMRAPRRPTRAGHDASAASAAAM